MTTEHFTNQVFENINYKINHGDRYWADLSLPKIEEMYKSKYIGDFTINNGAGWTEYPVSLFYNPAPDDPSYSNYFGVFIKAGHVYITNGISTTDIDIMGVISNDNEIIYSRYRHDYRLSTDGTVMIDGGRDYLRTNTAKTVIMRIIVDELQIIEIEKPYE